MSQYRTCRHGTSSPPVRMGMLAVCLSAALTGLTASSLAQAASPSAQAYRPPDWTAPQALDKGSDIQPTDLAAAIDVWRKANAEVAEFPRGHIDLMRWEKLQQRRSSADAIPAMAASKLEPLGLAEVLSKALTTRPDLLARPGSSAQRIAMQKVELADLRREIQNTWVTAVVSRQAARYQLAALQNTRAGTALGRRMVRAGNWSQARYLEEQQLEADAWQSLAQARAAELGATEALARQMGISDPMAVQQLAERLPTEVPAPDPSAMADLPKSLMPEQMNAVLNASPEILAAAQKSTRHLNALPAGRWEAWQAALVTSMQNVRNATELPRLDDERLWRDGALQEAVEAQAEIQALTVERQSAIREAWAILQWRSATVAHLEQTVVPLANASEQETLLRYNGMLQSTWELLASARDRLQRMQAAALARADYWMARANWEAMASGADSKLAAADTSATSAKSSNGAGH